MNHRIDALIIQHILCFKICFICIFLVSSGDFYSHFQNNFIWNTGLAYIKFESMQRLFGSQSVINIIKRMSSKESTSNSGQVSLNSVSQDGTKKTCDIPEDQASSNKQDITLVACGSYNPITNMHLRMFELARDYLHTHKSEYVVSQGFISPVSDGYGKADLVSGLHRKNMCERAVKSNPWIKVMDWELNKEEWTPTVDVLNHYETVVNEDKKLNKKVMLLGGADFLQSFFIKDMWLEKDIRAIVQHHGLLVITRPSYNPLELIEQSDLLLELRKYIHVIPELITNDTSSTKIRQAIRGKQSIRYLTPDPVVEYISQNKLYCGLQSSISQELAPVKRQRT